jgi:hypothetical protein
LHLDFGIDEVHDGEVSEDVRKVLGERVELSPQERSLLGQALLSPVQLCDFRPKLPDLALFLAALELEGEPFLAGPEEVGLEGLDLSAETFPREAMTLT